MPTDLSTEQEEQRRWVPRPKYAHVTIFDALVANEFLSTDEQLARQQRKLSRTVRFAATRVPYYQDLFRRLGLTYRDIRGPGDLRLLPALTKQLIQEDEARFKPPELPWGERPGPPTVSSGSTGPPTRVVHTFRSRLMFGFLKQRELRWCRFDPAGTFAVIRTVDNIPRLPDGRPFPEGKTARNPTWPVVGTYFKTGPYIGFVKSNPMERKVEWLEEHRPDYLQTGTALMEHLALAFQDRPPPDGLRGLNAISEPLTPGMRERIEKTFGVPVHQNYGMNEAGVIAGYCLEGRRYHVHTEHCLVEIADEEGTPCAPGKYGRLLVTVLTNDAMPLIRYDGDDMAQAVDGPCPCGRTLPSFGPVLGRYSKIAVLPPEILYAVNALRETMERLPPALSGNLREYQVHRRRDGDFELRLVVAQALPAEFATRIQDAWGVAIGSRPLTLSVVEVDHIPLAPSGKFFHYTSDFESSPASGAAPDRGGEPA